MAPCKNLSVPQGLSVAACVLVLDRCDWIGQEIQVGNHVGVWAVFCPSNLPDSRRGDSTFTRPMRLEWHLNGDRGDHGVPRGHWLPQRAASTTTPHLALPTSRSFHSILTLPPRMAWARKLPRNIFHTLGKRGERHSSVKRIAEGRKGETTWNILHFFAPHSDR